MKNPAQGLGAIFYKEVRHMRRDPMAILFALVMPVLQMIILGAAIDTNIRQVRTAVYDASGSAMATDVSAAQSAVHSSTGCVTPIPSKSIGTCTAMPS